jgi:hypothetical protein
MVRQPKPKALSSLQSDQRSYTSELRVAEVGLVSRELLSSGKVVGVEEIWYPRKGTWSSPVTGIAAVMMAAELL